MGCWRIALLCLWAVSGLTLELTAATALAQKPEQIAPAVLSSSGNSSLPNAPASQDGDDAAVTVMGTPRRIVLDEWSIVRSPAHLRKQDLKWLLPLTAATAVSFATDEKTQSEVVSRNPSFNQASVNASDALVGGLIAAPVMLFGAGSMRHSEHAREAGILGGEAMVDAYVAGALIKIVTFRQRPDSGNSEGSFFRTTNGVDSSFVSQHSLVAWSSASAIAAAYPNPWVDAGLYTAATGVSLTRVMGRQHFPTDVLLGSSVGWLIGHYVYRAHHSGGLSRRDQRYLRAVSSLIH